MSYVYIRSEPGLWTVGFYRPDGKWTTDSDHDDREEAAKRAAWLNGSSAAPDGEIGHWHAALVERIQAALTVARKHGDTDGGHHKQWVLNQMVMALTGGEERLPDEGIAP